jgi:glutamate transport system permease protein
MTTTMAPAREERAGSPRKARVSVLFDVPGPRARVRHRLLAVLCALVLLGVIALLVWKLDQKDQLNGRLWKPFTRADVWQNYIWHGLKNTLQATVVAAVLALVFGVVFGLGRLSEHWWLRVPAGIVVEFFRAIPVLIMMFFALAGPPIIADDFNRSIPSVTAFQAVVAGLTLYNGSVLAEIIRAGIQSVPRGQAEAGYSLGLRKGGVMLRILVPQAVTVMMPAIISQLVVLLKDSALGYIIAYEDLLNSGFVQVKNNYGNLIPAALVVTVIYIAMNMTLGYFANWLERRSRRSRKSSARPVGAPAAAGADISDSTA